MQGNGSNHERSILAQLSGLKLSDGSTAADRVKFHSTPPSVSSPSGGNVFAAAPVSGNKITDISRLLSSGTVHVGAPPQSSSPIAATTVSTSGEGKGDGKVKALALPKPRSEAQGVHSNESDSVPVHSTSNHGNGGGKQRGNDKASGKGPNREVKQQQQQQQQPVKMVTAPAEKNNEVLAAVAAAASPVTGTAIVLGDAGGSGGGLNPKVVEFFHKHSHLSTNATAAAVAAAPAVAANKPKIAIARAAVGGDAAAASVPPPSGTDAVEGRRGASSGPSPEERKAALTAIQFLRDAFGVVDNCEATRPIIRSLPKVPAGGRYIIVGDVHGCVDQLEALIQKVRYEKGKDCLVMIGDYVNKGPDSVGAVEACMRHQALGVLGNHDYTLLRCINRHRRKPFQPDDLRDPVKQLAKVFPLECEYYLRGLPHILKLPEYNVLLVHAGLNTQHALLEDQNVYELMHLRRLEKIVTNDAVHHKKEVTKYQAVVKGSAGVPWGELWEGPEQVIFGHDAYSGFQVHAKATGIDTGCVYGDPLTCVVFGPESPQGEYFHVPGLPKSANELRGLPPPDAAIYEQQQLELERQIIRPTPSLAAASGNSSNSGSPITQRPVFLSTPVSQAAPLSGRVLTTTVTSTNARLTPASSAAVAAAFPSRLVTPTSAMGAAVAQEVADVSAREVQKSTLLALSAAHQLAAIATLLAMPVYENSLEIMQQNDADDAVAIGSFWTPFIRNILTAAQQRLAASAHASMSAPLPEREAAVEEEETLLYALGVCDDLEKVQAEVQSQLKALQDPAIVGRLSKAAKKYVDLLVH